MNPTLGKGKEEEGADKDKDKAWVWVNDFLAARMVTTNLVYHYMIVKIFIIIIIIIIIIPLSPLNHTNNLHPTLTSQLIHLSQVNPVATLEKKTRGGKHCSTSKTSASTSGTGGTGSTESGDDHDATASETLLLQLLHVLIDTYGMVHTECDLTPSSPEQRIVQVTPRLTHIHLPHIY